MCVRLPYWLFPMITCATGLVSWKLFSLTLIPLILSSPHFFSNTFLIFFPKKGTQSFTLFDPNDFYLFKKSRDFLLLAVILMNSIRFAFCTPACTDGLELSQHTHTTHRSSNLPSRCDFCRFVSLLLNRGSCSWWCACHDCWSKGSVCVW